MRQTIPPPPVPAACDATVYAEIVRGHWRGMTARLDDAPDDWTPPEIRCAVAADGWTFGDDVSGEVLTDEDAAVAAWWTWATGLGEWGVPLDGGAA